MVRTRVTPHNKVSKARFQKNKVSKGHPPKGFQSSKAKFKGVSKGHPPKGRFQKDTHPKGQSSKGHPPRFQKGFKRTPTRKVQRDTHPGVSPGKQKVQRDTHPKREKKSVAPISEHFSVKSAPNPASLVRNIRFSKYYCIQAIPARAQCLAGGLMVDSSRIYPVSS